MSELQYRYLYLIVTRDLKLGPFLYPEWAHDYAREWGIVDYELMPFASVGHYERCRNDGVEDFDI